MEIIITPTKFVEMIIESIMLAIWLSMFLTGIGLLVEWWERRR